MPAPMPLVAPVIRMCFMREGGSGCVSGPQGYAGCRAILARRSCQAGSGLEADVQHDLIVEKRLVSKAVVSRSFMKLAFAPLDTHVARDTKTTFRDLMHKLSSAVLMTFASSVTCAGITINGLPAVATS